MPLTPQLDLKLICSFATPLGVRKQRMPTLATVVQRIIAKPA